MFYGLKDKIKKLLLALIIIWLAGAALMSYIFYNINSDKTNLVYQLKGGVFNEIDIKNLPVTAGRFVWLDNHKTYYSYGEDHFILRVNNKWDTAKIEGIENFDNKYVWDGGSETYYSKGSEQYILDDEEWKPTTEWNLSTFDGNNIWTDGLRMYYSNGYVHYVLKSGKWQPVNWNGFKFYGENVWMDSHENIYYSDGTTHYMLNDDEEWEVKNWVGLNNFYGKYIWTVGEDYTFYSYGNQQYILSNDMWVIKNWNLSSFNGDDIWTDSKNNVFYYGYNAPSIEEAQKDYVIKKSIKEGLSWPTFVVDNITKRIK